MNEVATAIRSKLDSAGVAVTANIWRNIADPGTAPPYVVFSHVSGVNTIEDSADYASELWDVKVVTKDDAAAAATTAAAIRSALHGAALTVSGWGLLSCYAVNTIEYEERETDKRIYHRGYTFRILIEQRR